MQEDRLDSVEDPFADGSDNAGRPRFCDIVISNKCMLGCKMCRSWKTPAESNELSFEDCKKFISQLSEFVKPPMEINIMGGEPLLKEWCLDLCRFIAEKGFTSIISTNAYLIDEPMARKIADSRLSVLAISLESLKEETHDFLRGKKGVLSRVKIAVENLEKHCKNRLAITVLTIIMQKNLDDILELAEWVNSNSLFANISFLALLETGLVHPRKDWFKKPEYGELWPHDVKKTHSLIDELIRLKASGYKIWNPVAQLEAFKSYYIDPEKFMEETPYRIKDYIIDLDEAGIIYLSGETLGDIRKDNLKDLWFSDKAGLIRKDIDRNGPGKRCCVVNFIVAFEEQKDFGFRSHLKLAEFYAQKGYLVKAAEEFRQAIQIDPKSQEAHQSLGICYRRLKQWDDAITELVSVLDVKPGSILALQELGFCYLEKGDVEKAINTFSRALQLHPENEHASHGLGLCYRKNKDFDRAIEQFNKALGIINSDRGYINQDLGFCYLEKGEMEKAIDAFNKAIKINPENEQAHHGLGLCYRNDKDFDRAIEEFNKALELNTGRSYFYYDIGLCHLDKGSIGMAISAFRQGLAIDPGDIRCLLEIGRINYMKRKYENALNDLNEVLRLDPSNKDALFCLKKINKSKLYRIRKLFSSIGKLPKLFLFRRQDGRQ